MSLRKILGVWYGTDPEGFLSKDGRVIGSERVIPEGLQRVVRDGIQFELHPEPTQNIRALGLQLRQSFQDLKQVLSRHPGVSVDFRGVIEVERAELDSLSEDSRILGCMPSRNAYQDRPITVDPVVYRKRSAGGHEHFGIRGTKLFGYYGEPDDRSRLIPLLDMIVGNTGVLFDRDPLAAERRVHYGRAGEYRLPDHGIEYRTLSNFWLRNYTLMSMVFGLSEIALAVLVESLSGNDIEQELVDSVDIQSFIQAIDTNDFELARKNFLTIRPFLVKHLPEKGSTFVVTPRTLDKLLVFADLVKVKGLENIFPESPVEHWISGQFEPIEDFLRRL